MSDELEPIFLDPPDPPKPPAAPPPAPRQRAPTIRPEDHTVNGAGRSLPHSFEAEQNLLSILFIDDGETLGRALDAKIVPESFFHPANGIIFRILVQLRAKKVPVTIETAIEELNAAKLMEAIGGGQYLAEVSARIPTTAQASYFIAKVRDLWLLRKAIKITTAAIEEAYSFTGEVEELLQQIQSAFEQLSDKTTAAGAKARALMELTASEDERRAANLLGDGFLRRTQGLLLPGATGIGKSSLMAQAAILWALDRPFFGIEPQGPLSSVITQAENDDIDLVEMRDGIGAELELIAEERAIVAKRVHVITTYERGAALFRCLDPEVKRLKPDLLFLDPVFAYIEGAVKDQEAVTTFLRGQLQPFLVKHNLGAILLHHTNKPPTGREKVTWQAGDFAYTGSGSIEFANWARAVVLIRSIGSLSVFELMLPKRGKRAGIVYADGNPVISQYIRHSKKAGIIFWEPATIEDVEASPPDGFIERLFKAFYAMKRSDDGSVKIAALARRLQMSTRNLNRKFQGADRITFNGEVLRREDGRVFLEGDEE